MSNPLGMQIRTQTPQRQTRRDTVQVLAKGRPRERFVRDALRRFDEHRFAVPVVVPARVSAPTQSGDW
jgi:hypothetical protein